MLGFHIPFPLGVPTRPRLHRLWSRLLEDDLLLTPPWADATPSQSPIDYYVDRTWENGFASKPIGGAVILRGQETDSMINLRFWPHRDAENPAAPALLIVRSKTTDVARLVNLALDVMREGEAPLGAVEVIDDGLFARRRWFAGRFTEKVGAYPKTPRHAGAQFAMGVGFRTLIGPHLAAYVGQDTLADLAAEGGAERRGAHWVLSGAATPEDWRPDAFCDAERRIVERIGARRFLDLRAIALPEVWPPLPGPLQGEAMFFDEASRSHWIEKPDGSRLPVEKPPRPAPLRYAHSPPPAPLAHPVFTPLANQAAAAMRDALPGFDTDSPLYWVEVYLMDQPSDRHAALTRVFGAWLGEFIRARGGGDWAQESDGWVFKGTDGTAWNVHGRVAKHLADPREGLSLFVEVVCNPPKPPKPPKPTASE